MFAWLSRVLTPREPEQPRLSARVTLLENRSDDLESRLEYVASELKSVRGRQFALEKRRQDDAGATIDDESVSQQPPSSAGNYFPTAHLSRRFRGF